MKKTFKIFKRVMLKYRVAVICFLLSFAIFAGGAVSYSRYVTEGKFYDRPGVGQFVISALVDDVSALTFTNMAFWGGLEDIGVSMNSLRTVYLSVDNYETDEQGNRKISDVALEYSLLFASPVSFANKLAIQLSDISGTVMTPQIVLADLIKSVDEDEPVGTFETTQPKYNGKTYSGTDQNGNISNFISFDVTLDVDTGIYTASAKGHNNLVITLEPFVMEDMKQTLYFRLWDVVSQESTQVLEEGGTLLPPLKVNYVDDIECYKISVSHDSFKFPADTPTERDYTLTLAPTDALLDSYLGGYLMTENNGVLSNATVIVPGESLSLSTVIEVATSSNKSTDEVTLMGHIPNHSVGDVVENNLGKTIKETTYQNVYTATSSFTDYANPVQTVNAYYTKNNRNTWRSSNQNDGLYRITKQLIPVTNTTTTYDATIRETISATEKLTTVAVKDNNTLIEQSGKRTSSQVGDLIDAFKRETVQVEYVEVTTYWKRAKKNEEWKETVESDFSGMRESLRPDDLVAEHEHPVYYDAVALTPDEISELKTVDEVKALLVNTTTTSDFTRVINYTATVEDIVPLSLSSTDSNVPTDPFKTHLESGIQKYYLSTSYSKNYPFFVKILFRQIQD